jgi:uncharacterized membrane protein
MRRAVDFIVQLTQFAGVAVAFAGVVVAVVRTAVASLAGDRSQRFSGIRLDLARTVLLGIDVLLASAVLEVAVTVQEVSYNRLATVAALRIILSVLIAVELRYQADINGADMPAGSTWRAVSPWTGSLRREAPAAPGRRADAHRRPATRVRPRHRRLDARLVSAEPPAENLWPDRARLGRDTD